MSMELSFNSPNQTVTTIADGPTSHVGATHEKAGGSSSLVSMSSTSLTRSMMDLSLMQDSQYQLHRSNVSNNNNSTVVGVDGKMGSGPQAPHTQQHQQHHQLITDSNSPSDASHGTTTFFSIASPENSSPFLKDHASPLLRQQQQQQIQQHQLHDSQKAVLIGAAPNSGVTVTVGTASAAIARVQQHPAQPAIVGVPQQRKTNLYVSSLPKHFSEGDLLQMFQRYGNVVSCMAARDAVGGCKGYGFVNFANEASATQAISELHGLLLQGRMLHVRLADPRANPPPTLKQAVPQIVAPSQLQSGNSHPYQQSQQNPVHVHQQVYTAHQQQMLSHQQTQSQSASSYQQQQQQQQHYFVEPPQQQQHQQQQHVLPPHHQQQQHQQQQQHVVYREHPHQQALGIDYQQQQAHYAQQQQHQTPYAHQQQSMQFHYPTERRDSGDSTASGMGGSLSALTVHSAAAFQGYSQDEYYAAQQRQQQQQQQQQQQHQQQQQQQHSRQHPFSYPHHQQQPQQPHQQQAVAYQHQLQAAQQHRQAVALHPPTQGYPQQHQAPHLLQQQQHAYRVMQPGSFSHQSNGPTVLSTGDEVRYVRERTRGPSEYTYDSIIS